MAAVAVTVDNLRVEDCEATTGFANIGGGAGGAVEAPFKYQGNLLYNRKVTSATGAGFEYVYTNDGGTAVDMTATRRKTWMVKCMVSDYGGLDVTDGVLVRIGSTSANYYAYVLAGTDSPAAFADAYRDIGGLLVIPVDPNESASYNDVAKDAGSPTLTSADYFGYVCAFSSSTAKNENVGLDAIDIGSGLYLVGGDGVSTDGVYQDFADFDGNTVGNRYGYARNADGGSILAYGEWRIGTTDDSTSTATGFSDPNAVVVWLDHLAGAGFSVLVLDYGNSSTAIADGALHIGAGSSTNVDSRPDLVCKKLGGATGTCSVSGTYRNFREVTFLSDTDVDGADIECLLLTQASAEIQNTTIRTRSLTSVACLQDPTFGTSDLHDSEFIQSGAGHAVEIATAATYTFTNLTWSGYGADTTDSAALDITASSGTVTINVVGGTTPTYKTAGATVVLVINPVTITVTVVDSLSQAAVVGARVLVKAGDGAGDLPFDDTVTIAQTTGTATVTHTTHGMETGDEVEITEATPSAYNGIKTITVTTANAYTFAIDSGTSSPATGTIKASGVVINGVTNGSGVITDTRAWSLDQVVTGTVKKGTSSPVYKSGPIAATIDKTAGVGVTVQLTPDE